MPFAAAVHKGQRGRVAIVGGDEGMTGAARMAARAAFAGGAGLVHAGRPAASVAMLARGEPDLQTTAQLLRPDPARGPPKVLGGADAAVIGPGLGRSPSRPEFIEAVIQALPPSAPS